MDSKLRNQAVLAVLGVIALIVVMVLYVNNDAGREDASAVSTNTAVNAEGEVYGPNLSQEELQAFLQDETFFDPEPTPDYSLSVNDAGDPMLYLVATSMQRDIRISVVNGDGEVVSGESFFVTVDGEGEYKDLDQDGLIYIPDLSAGDYFVSLEPIDGYEVPEDPMRVTVREQLEYAVIDDISFHILTEDEINVTLEDTQESSAEADAEETEHTEQLRPENAAFGIDVSKWQGDINWAEVAAAGVEFVIIRCGYRGSSSGCLVVDPYFIENIEGAKAAGLDVGVYFFTQAINEVEAVEEASMVVSLCENYDLDYPVFIDTEGAGGNGRADGLDAETRTLVCEAFCETVQSAGYHAGVYASRNWYYNQLEDERLSTYVLWVAEYREEPLYTGNYSLWQYTSSGSVNGINTRVDLNISYFDVE